MALIIKVDLIPNVSMDKDGRVQFPDDGVKPLKVVLGLTDFIAREIDFPAPGETPRKVTILMVPNTRITYCLDMPLASFWHEVRMMRDA
jgi:hypothetical protein